MAHTAREACALPGCTVPTHIGPTPLQVGDGISFTHFGVKNRPGLIRKITPTRIYVEWIAVPGATRPRTVAVLRKYEGTPFGKAIRLRVRTPGEEVR